MYCICRRTSTTCSRVITSKNPPRHVVFPRFCSLRCWAHATYLTSVHDISHTRFIVGVISLVNCNVARFVGENFSNIRCTRMGDGVFRLIRLRIDAFKSTGVWWLFVKRFDNRIYSNWLSLLESQMLSVFFFTILYGFAEKCSPLLSQLQSVLGSVSAVGESYEYINQYTLFKCILYYIEIATNFTNYTNYRGLRNVVIESHRCVYRLSIILIIIITYVIPYLYYFLWLVRQCIFFLKNLEYHSFFFFYLCTFPFNFLITLFVYDDGIIELIWSSL